MEQWYSIHFYPEDKSQEQFLAVTYRSFLEKNVWSERGVRAFFIRYEDESGHHLRLRWKGSAEWLQKTLEPAFAAHFKKKGAWKLAEYVPEPDRFGGEEALVLAEEHFHISTRVVLARMARPNYEYGDALFDAMRLQVSAVRSAGLSLPEMAAYFDRLCTQWTRVFFNKEDEAMSDADFQARVRAAFDKNMQPQYHFLKDALTQFYHSLEAPQPDPKQPEWMRWLKGNELVFNALGTNLEKALPSLLHLTNNRLGIYNQDEAYMLYVLSKVLQA